MTIARLALAVYATLLRLSLPLWWLRFWWRGRAEPLYRQAWGERLGWSAQSAVPGAVWIHAVSLGETRAAAALVQALRSRRPGMRLLLTHGTATGRQAGQALLREGDRQCWLPLDTPGACRRFLRAHRPAVGILMETEVWPQLLAQAHRERVPMVLANARLSAGSQRKGRRWAWLMRPAVSSLAAVLAQTEDDATRLRALGARGVQVCGNLKYDLTPEASLVERGRRWRRELQRPVLLLASAREGEEAMLLRGWAQASAGSPPPLLLVVPRHPQRFGEVAAQLRQAGLRVALRSGLPNEPDGQAAWADAAGADAWLGDSMGEMPLYYAMADIALLGGSFAPLGGQNLIEAAACSCPLVMGPHTFNFEQAAQQALQAGAALRARDLGDALEQAAVLLRAPQTLHDMAQRAQAFAQAHRGAAARMAEALDAVEASGAARAAGRRLSSTAAR